MDTLRSAPLCTMISEGMRSPLVVWGTALAIAAILGLAWEWHLDQQLFAYTGMGWWATGPDDGMGIVSSIAETLPESRACRACLMLATQLGFVGAFMGFMRFLAHRYPHVPAS